MKIEGATKITREERFFIESYFSWIFSFREALYIYQNTTYNVKRDSVLTVLQNADLWCDANIEKYPFIQEFRDEVLQAYKDNNINKHRRFAYDHNHFKE